MCLLSLITVRCSISWEAQPAVVQITGGQVGTGCGTLNDGKSTLASGPGKKGKGLSLWTPGISGK